MNYLYWFNLKLKYWYHPRGKVKEFFRFLRFVWIRIKHTRRVWRDFNKIIANRMDPKFDKSYNILVDSVERLIKGMK